jgi:hypothetical protein
MSSISVELTPASTSWRAKPDRSDPSEVLPGPDQRDSWTELGGEHQAWLFSQAQASCIFRPSPWKCRPRPLRTSFGEGALTIDGGAPSVGLWIAQDGRFLKGDFRGGVAASGASWTAATLGLSILGFGRPRCGDVEREREGGARSLQANTVSAYYAGHC